MTGAEMYTQHTGMNDGRAMDETLYYQLINLAKGIIERSRPWRKLLAIDSSQTVTSSNTYTTMKSLPSDFGMTVSRKPLSLVSGDDVVEVTQIQFEDRYKYKNTFGYYYIDIANDQFALTGAPDKTYTIHMPYFKLSTAIAAGVTWVFPSEFHSLLNFMVDPINKGAIDWDDIHSRMAPEGRAVAKSIEHAMNMWDAHLQKAALNV